MDRQLLGKLLVVISFISTLSICSLSFSDIILTWSETDVASGIKDFDNTTPLLGDWNAGSGDLVQLIKAGGNVAPDPVEVIGGHFTGLPTGDDVLIDTIYIGYGLYLPNQGVFDVAPTTYTTLAVDDWVFVRAFNDSLAADASHYGDSILFQITIPITETPPGNVNIFDDAGDFYTDNPVPEPAMMMILLPGLALMTYFARRKR